jgi:hypothetical protein
MSTLESVGPSSIHDRDGLTSRLLALPSVSNVEYVGLGTPTAHVRITCTCDEPNSVVADITRASKLSRAAEHQSVSTALCVKPMEQLIKLSPA